VREVMGGHALEHGGSGLLLSDALRDGHQTVGYHGCIFGIGAVQPAPGHAIADLDRGYLAANLGYDASAFLPEYEGQRRFVPAFAEVNVDKVDSGGGQFYYGFIGLGLGNG